MVLNTILPSSKVAFKQDIEVILSKLALKVDTSDASNGIARADAHASGISIKKVNMANGVMPNVTKMGVKDAVYLLENIGLKVVIMGSGMVVSQSPTAGKTFAKGDQAKIIMQ